MRSLALERGISLIEIWREAERDGWVIDRILDERQKALGKNEDNFIIDWRLAFHFIPHAIKVFLTVSAEEAAKRIFADESRKWLEIHENMEDAIQNITIRRTSEDERYMKYYGLHIYDMSLYDIVVDTSNKSPDEVFSEVYTRIHEQKL